MPASWNYRDTRSGYRGRTHISVVYALLVLLATADLCASAQVCARKKRKCPTGAATNASARELRSMTSHFIGQCSRWWQDTSLHGCSPDKFTLGCSSAEHAYWPWLLSSRKFVRFVAKDTQDHKRTPTCTKMAISRNGLRSKNLCRFLRGLAILSRRADFLLIIRWSKVRILAGPPTP